MFRSFSILLLAATALSLSAQPSKHQGTNSSENRAIHNVFWQPNEVHQGSPIFITVELERPAIRVTGKLLEKPIVFFADARSKKTWHALAGIDLETNPGDYNADVTVTFAGHRIARSTSKVTITSGNFGTGNIDVSENLVNPSAAEQKQIAQDEQLKKRAYARGMALHPLWSGDFIKPVAAPSTPSFGESRILNEEKTSLHTGTDFPIAEGSPVHLSNSGTVVLVRDLFYEGNTVIVSHGLGLFTVYLHLSRIDVQEGDKLAKDASLGLSGASGRVTGPHLHMGVRWNGVWVDPVELINLTLPKTGTASFARSIRHGTRSTSRRNSR
jgi:hypothetical protein